jgi:hypothetical protein
MIKEVVRTQPAAVEQWYNKRVIIPRQRLQVQEPLLARRRGGVNEQKCYQNIKL